MTTQSQVLAVINFLQKYQYRDGVSISSFASDFESFEHQSLLKRVLSAIFANAHVFINNKSTILPFISACTNEQFLLKRLKSILSIIKDNNSIGYKSEECKRILSECSLHYQEAKFYTDLLTGCKFGIPDSLMGQILNNQPNNQLINDWVQPKILKNYKLKYPVYAEIRYLGRMFKAIIKNGNLTILSKKHKTPCTQCFPELQILTKICPKDRTSYIDFMITAEDDNYHSVCWKVDNYIDNNQPIHLDTMLLDFYWENETQDLSVRKTRLSKLVKRLRSRGVNNAHETSARLIKDEQSLRKFITNITKKHVGVMVKPLGSKPNTSIYKYITPRTIETVKVLDYKYKFEPSFKIDYVTTITESRKQLILGSNSFSNQSIIQNLVGKYIKIKWKPIYGEMTPVYFCMR